MTGDGPHDAIHPSVRFGNVTIMAIRCRCAACGTAFSVGEEFEGEEVRCVRCRQPVAVPLKFDQGEPAPRAAAAGEDDDQEALLATLGLGSAGHDAHDSAAHWTHHHRRPNTFSWPMLLLIAVALVAIVAVASAAVVIMMSGKPSPPTLVKHGKTAIVLNVAADQLSQTKLWIDDKPVTLPETGKLEYALTPEREHHVSMGRSGQHADCTFTPKAGDRIPFVPVWQSLTPEHKEGPVAVLDDSFTSVPMRMQGALMAVDVELGGSTVEMVVDSGAEAVAIPWRMAKEAGVDLSSGQVIAVGGVGGGALGYQVTLPSLRVGQCVVRDVTCLVMAPEAPPTPALLGQSFLNPADAQPDYRNHRLFLRRTAGP
jgi:clan AA aspartic protease (TIGR02281 family)